MIPFTLRQLTYFCTTADCGSIAQASRTLGVSSPAIAAALDKLEDVSGLTLFDRFPAHGLRLTASGQAFLGEARQVLSQAESLAHLTRTLSSDTQGHVRFGSYYALAYIFAAPIVLHHRDLWPRVTVQVIEDTFLGLKERLEDGRVDLMLTYDQELDQSRFDIVPLCEATPRVILPDTHPLATRSRISLQDLEGEPYVMVEEKGPGLSFLDMLNAAGLFPEVAVASRSYEFVRSCVGKGMGFTLTLFQPPHPRTYHGDGVVAVPLREHIGTAQVVIAARKGRLAEPLLRNLTQTCRHILDLPDAGQITDA